MKRQIAEILLVGTELLLGDIMDTNGKYLARELSDLGIDLYYQTVVGDNPKRLREAVNRALERSDVVISSGGLGPTCDDITRGTFADALGLELKLHEPTVERLKSFFTSVGRKMTDNNMRQAMVPEGATVLTNDWGTAPGLYMKKDQKHAFLLPGPPRELEPMFRERVRPILFDMSDRKFVSDTLEVYGIGESALEEKLRDLMQGADPSLAPYAKDGEVLLRITSSGADVAEAKEKNRGMIQKVLERAGEYVYDINGESLQRALVERFSKKGLKIATAESLTGGLISKRITSVSGASAVFELGICSYSDRIKNKILSVSEASLEEYSAVSEAVAMEMAEGARRLSGADIAVSATGYAGPTGERVGLVYIGVSSSLSTRAVKLDTGRRTGEREYIRSLSASRAIAEALREAGLFSWENSCCK